jgi:hypothetical protein
MKIINLKDYLSKVENLNKLENQLLRTGRALGRNHMINHTDIILDHIDRVESQSIKPVRKKRITKVG